MTRISEEREARQGRVFPERQLSLEEKARRKAEEEALIQRCEAIFERVKPEIIQNKYNWFMVIEPDSGDYCTDEDEEVAAQKLREKYPNAWCVVLRINETGTYCRV